MPCITTQTPNTMRDDNALDAIAAAIPAAAIPAAAIPAAETPAAVTTAPATAAKQQLFLENVVVFCCLQLRESEQLELFY